MVNTERKASPSLPPYYYNILNIVVNTEHYQKQLQREIYYNILNIVVNTELNFRCS